VKYKYIIGIDEAGRGPLAGPVCVGAVCLGKNFNKKLLRGVKDSKKLSEKKREGWFLKVKSFSDGKDFAFAVSLVSSKIIDKKGIVFAIKLAIKRCLKKVGVNPKETRVLLDGSLKAPKEFINQKTIIKGDEKERVISLASVCAKVSRDRYMVKISKIFPKYGFHIHKGYGTKKHRELIKKHGASLLHRKSFLKSFS